jgi:hypothetical protein
MCKSIDFGLHLATVIEGCSLRSSLLDLTAGNAKLHKKNLVAVLNSTSQNSISSLRAVVHPSPEDTTAAIKNKFENIADADARGASLWLNEFSSRAFSENLSPKQTPLPSQGSCVSQALFTAVVSFMMCALCRHRRHCVFWVLLVLSVLIAAICRTLCGGDGCVCCW